MTKVHILNLIFLVFFSCVGTKYITTDFTGSSYNCDLGSMVGKTVIQFNEGQFLYSERDSLFYGNGQWRISEDGKYILLTGHSDYNYSSPDLSLEKEINLKLKIKGKNTLIGNDKVFKRIE